MADERSGSGKSRRNGSAKSKGSNITDTVSKLTVRALQSLNLSEVEDANLPTENTINAQENEIGKKSIFKKFQLTWKLCYLCYLYRRSSRVLR